MRAFFVAGSRGWGGQAAIEVANHESEPLRIEKVEHPTERFATQLETLEPGQRYRLTLNLKPDGPGGRSTDTILLQTSSKKLPELKVDANTYLFERVRTFPDGVDFGTVRAGDADIAPQTLMIYQHHSHPRGRQYNSRTPITNRAGEGFENKIAQAVAKALGEKVAYTWASYRGHGGFTQFLSTTRKRSDMVMNIPYATRDELTTRPYYISSYVFVFEKAKKYDITSMDSPAGLKTASGEIGGLQEWCHCRSWAGSEW
jgi:hypothetical protein